MKRHWLPFQYRDFYDIPRAILVEYEDALYFFDCPFSDEQDDYEESYAVYKIPEDIRKKIDVVSWADLSARSIRVGSVPLDAVEFDPTKRHALNARVFDLLKAP